MRASTIRFGDGFYRITWWRTLRETAGSRFWRTLGALVVAMAVGLVASKSIVVVVGLGAALLLVVAWLAVTTSEYLKHR
ncbi:MAG TPA: hypothetical protein VL856_07810 [Acidimicrobiia bacterium]|nr:hypothetical protein [Acidimicrobiia bacterium]